MTEKNQTKKQLTQANHETNITERKFKQEEEIALHYPKPQYQVKWVKLICVGASYSS